MKSENIYLRYSFVKGKKLIQGSLKATFSSYKEKKEFLESEEAKMWSNYYMGASYK